MNYKVTIGIPVYNVEKFIHLSMDSALNQTFQSIEFLVLDDCGTDSSMDIVREYQKNHPRGKDIHIVRQPRNGGLGRARNRIIEEAQGTYLYHLDADDAIALNTIELLYQNAIKNDADIVFGSFEKIEVFDESVKKIQICYPFMVFREENKFADRVYSEYGFLQASTCNFLIKKEIYFKHNLRHKPVNYWEDFSFTIDLPVYVNRVVLLPDVTYFYYCRYGSLSNYSKRNSIDKEEILKTIDAMRQVKQISRQIKSKPYFHKRMYKVMMTHFYIACSIIRSSNKIAPSFTKREIRDIMRSPLSFGETLSLKGWKLRNIALYLLGVLPPLISYLLIYILGKSRKLI